MIPRDFRPTFRVLAADLKTFLAGDPTAIDGLLFRAIRSQTEELTTVPDPVGSMEASEKIFEYADPVPVKAKELPFEFPVPMDTADEHGSGYADQPVAMLLDADKVPKGSVLIYDEYDDAGSDSIQRRILYIQAIGSTTKHPGAASVYFMLPFMDLEEKFKDAQ